jgi:hypothetical protein
MVLSDISVADALDSARRELGQADNLSPALKGSMELLIVIVSLLSHRLGLNS